MTRPFAGRRSIKFFSWFSGMCYGVRIIFWIGKENRPLTKQFLKKPFLMRSAMLCHISSSIFEDSDFEGKYKHLIPYGVYMVYFPAAFCFLTKRHHGSDREKMEIMCQCFLEEFPHYLWKTEPMQYLRQLLKTISTAIGEYSESTFPENSSTDYNRYMATPMGAIAEKMVAIQDMVNALTTPDDISKIAQTKLLIKNFHGIMSLDGDILFMMCHCHYRTLKLRLDFYRDKMLDIANIVADELIPLASNNKDLN